MDMNRVNDLKKKYQCGIQHSQYPISVVQSATNPEKFYLCNGQHRITALERFNEAKALPGNLYFFHIYK